MRRILLYFVKKFSQIVFDKPEPLKFPGIPDRELRLPQFPRIPDPEFPMALLRNHIARLCCKFHDDCDRFPGTF